MIFPVLGDIKLMSLFVKGKKPQLPNDYRVLVEDSSGSKMILFHDDSKGPFGGLESIDESDLKLVSEDHIKNRGYNYYKVGDDVEVAFEDMINRWLINKPLVCTDGSYLHTRYDRTVDTVVLKNGVRLH